MPRRQNAAGDAADEDPGPEHVRIQEDAQFAERGGAGKGVHLTLQTLNAWILGRPEAVKAGTDAPRVLRGDLLVGESRNARPLGGMLDRERAHVALGVELKERVLVEIAGLGDRARLEFDVQRVGIGEERDFHSALILGSLREVSIEESIVNRLTIGEEHHAQVASVPLRNLGPAPDATVRLNDLPSRRLNRSLDPLVEDVDAIRPGAHYEKILRAFHRSIEAGAKRPEYGIPRNLLGAGPCRAGDPARAERLARPGILSPLAICLIERAT